jgi:hypothetical protein
MPQRSGLRPRPSGVFRFGPITWWELGGGPNFPRMSPGALFTIHLSIVTSPNSLLHIIQLPQRAVKGNIARCSERKSLCDRLLWRAHAIPRDGRRYNSSGLGVLRCTGKVTEAGFVTRRSLAVRAPPARVSNTEASRTRPRRACLGDFALWANSMIA